MLYRIWTEDVLSKRKALEQLIGKRFKAYSILNAIGYWQGTKEKSICIEIELYSKQKLSIIKLAKNIKALLNQEAVLVQKISTVSKSI